MFRDAGGAVRGVVYFGTQLVIAADSDEAVDAFAFEARRHPGLRSFVGAKSCVDRLWHRVCEWHRPPVLARTCQPVYVLSASTRRPAPAAGVRQATSGDLDLVLENSALMMLAELGYDPRFNRSGFAAAIRRAIALGHWWVWIEAGELRFQLNVGARTGLTAQLQGVWTPPPVRRHGYALAALGQIASRLLTENPTLSLYVNDFNEDAIRLYERAGFIRTGAMSTLIFA